MAQNQGIDQKQIQEAKDYVNFWLNEMDPTTLNFSWKTDEQQGTPKHHSFKKATLLEKIKLIME